MKNTSSIYSASFTAASMMFNETLVVVRMLLEENSPATKKKLKEDAQYLRIQATSSRERVTIELSKRFDTMPRSFGWTPSTVPSASPVYISVFGK